MAHLFEFMHHKSRSESAYGVELETISGFSGRKALAACRNVWVDSTGPTLEMNGDRG
jgi:hypothetical protein